jgi:hypothetical protein
VRRGGQAAVQPARRVPAGQRDTKGPTLGDGFTGDFRHTVGGALAQSGSIGMNMKSLIHEAMVVGGAAGAAQALCYMLYTRCNPATSHNHNRNEMLGEINHVHS